MFSVVIFLLAGATLLAGQDKNIEGFVTVTVVDEKSGPITGLNADNFRVKVNNTVTKLTSVTSADEAGSVGLLIDTSGSLGGFNVQAIAESVKGFVDSSNSKNEYAVAGFGDSITLYQYFTSNPTATKAILDEFHRLERRGNTRFYDAIKAGVELIQSRPPCAKLLFIVTDATDNDSKSTFGEIKKLLAQSDVRLYVLVLSEEYRSRREFDLKFDRVKQLAKWTGGSAVSMDANESRKTADLIESATRIAREARWVYRIGFAYPGAGSDDKSDRNIEVEVRLPDDSKQHRRTKIRVSHRRQLYVKPSATLGN